MPSDSSPVPAPRSIARLPERALRAGRPMQDAFLHRGVATFHAACRWVHALPYGCNSTTERVAVLFEDGQGTCFTKHGVIARLAAELELPIRKQVGFYRLTDEIVTGVGALLRPLDLPFVPQLHCFLQYEDVRVDLTDGNRNGKNRTIDDYDFVVPVPPESTRAELERLYLDHLQRYRAIEPRLAATPVTTVVEVAKACNQLLLSRCGVDAGAAGTARPIPVPVALAGS